MNDSGPYLTRPDLVRAVRGEQRQRWQRGERVLVEELLQAHPTLVRDTEGVLDLIYSEVLLREATGETPSLDDYLARFPQWAEELQNQFEVHSVLEQPSQTPGSKPVSRLRLKSHPAGPPPDQPALAQAPLGYVILDELGRGGMGVVWKARHERLNRLVALKMIRHGPEARAEERTRFRTEAEAVARLSHPHIVQIYEVGDHNGQPYISLEYVDGPSLARRLADAPLPPRDAAALVETLARAVQYAHEQGIVHRDLKPANILLQEELTQRRQGAKEEESTSSSLAPWRLCVSSSIPKITDFGLAKLLDADTGQTHSGTLLGTPSYMAPEQAGDADGGRRQAVGPAADVYALGAVLYECLTGRPPFRGVTLVDTLLQVRTQDPVPPAQLQPQCPRDLETVCLKCLEKTPAKRYGRALDLADDLRRFLAGEPIHARPTPWRERAWKWARRRPAAAAALLAGALLLAVLVGFTLALRAALGRAESNFESAFQAVDDFFVQVAENRKLRQFDQRELLVALLGKARPYYERLVGQQGDDPRLHAMQAKAYLRLAEIVDEIEGPEKALDLARQGVALLHTLAARQAKEEYRRDLAAGLNLEGELCRQLGKYGDAKTAHEAGLGLRQALAEADPANVKDKADLAQSWNNLGLLRHAQRLWEPAEEAYKRAHELREELELREKDQPGRKADLAQSWNNLGWLAHDLKRHEDADRAYRQALRLRAELVAQSPNDPDYLLAWAKSRHNLAGADRVTKQVAQADEGYRQAVEAAQKLVRDHASVLEYRDFLALFRYNRALLWHYQDDQARDLNRARDLYRQALELWEGLPAAYRQLRPLTRRRMAHCNYEWGKCELLAGDRAKAQEKLAQAVALFVSAPSAHLSEADASVQDEDDRLEAARVSNRQGNVHYAPPRVREWSQAAPYFRQAVALWPAAALRSPEHRNELGVIYAKLSHCCEGERQWDDALAYAEKALVLWRGVREDNALRKSRALVRSRQALAWAHLGETAKALAAAQEIRKEPARVWACYPLARVYALQAARRREASQPAEAEVAEALRLLEEASSVFEERAAVRVAEDEPDLHALHARSEFQAWLEKLRKATATPAEP